MILFNPSRVLEQLPNYTRPTLSEPEPPIEQPLFRPKTPENTTDIKAHFSVIFSGLQDLLPLDLGFFSWVNVQKFSLLKNQFSRKLTPQLRAANALKKKSNKCKLSKGRILTAEEAKKIKEQKEETLRKGEEKKTKAAHKKKHLQNEILKRVATTSILLAIPVLLTLLVFNLLSVNLVLPAPINLVLLAASLGGGR